MHDKQLAQWLAQEHQIVVRVVTGGGMDEHRLAMPDCPVCAAIGRESFDAYQAGIAAHGSPRATAF